MEIPVKPVSHRVQDLYQDYSASRRAFSERLVSLLGPHLRDQAWADVTLLDVGCGEGEVAETFAAHGALAFAIDCDFGRVQNCARRMKSARSEKPVHLLQADGYRLPFVSGAFDVVLLSDVLEHVLHPETMLAEAARVLKLEGTAYIATTNRWSVLTTLTDPHYNIPGVNLMPRRVAAWYVTRLWRVSSEYGVGWYFSKARLRRLIAAAGFTGQEVLGRYEEKVRSGIIAKAAGRGWLIKMLRRRWVQAAAARFTRTAFFNILVQPGWEFLLKKCANSPRGAGGNFCF